MFCSFPSILCSPTHTHTQSITMFRRMYTCRGVCVCVRECTSIHKSKYRSFYAFVVCCCFCCYIALLPVIVTSLGFCCYSYCYWKHLRVFMLKFALPFLLCVPFTCVTCSLEVSQSNTHTNTQCLPALAAAALLQCNPPHPRQRHMYHARRLVVVPPPLPDNNRNNDWITETDTRHVDRWPQW